MNITLQSRIRAFLIKSGGCFSTKDIEEFKELLSSREIFLNHQEILDLIRIEKMSIERKSEVLFICESGPCRRSSLFLKNCKWIDQHGSKVEVESTICQWGCEQAPVATLYKNNLWTRFEQFNAGEVLNATK